MGDSDVPFKLLRWTFRAAYFIRRCTDKKSLAGGGLGGALSPLTNSLSLSFGTEEYRKNVDWCVEGSVQGPELADGSLGTALHTPRVAPGKV